MPDFQSGARSSILRTRTKEFMLRVLRKKYFLFAILLVMQLFLVRHGQDLNPDQKRLTDSDPPLSQLGKEQAISCALKIRAVIETDVTPLIISSPRLRTKQTAEILAIQLGQDPADIKTDVRLRERECATYFGQLVTEVFSRPEYELVEGGVEAYPKLVDRLREFYDDLPKQGNVIVVTHSGNILPFVRLANIDSPPSLDADSFLQLV